MVSSYSCIVNVYAHSSLNKRLFLIQNCLTNCHVFYKNYLLAQCVPQNQLKEALEHLVAAEIFRDTFKVIPLVKIKIIAS